MTSTPGSLPGPAPSSDDPPRSTPSCQRVALPWSRSCLICGEENPHGLRARSWLVGDRVELPFVARSEFAGWNAVVHGGFQAAVLDEVMTWAAIVATERACFAAEFSVRLRCPLPPGTKCVASARAVDERRGVHRTTAELRGGDDTLYATASGKYVIAPAGTAASMRHDFVAGPGTWPVDRIFGEGD